MAEERSGAGTVERAEVRTAVARFLVAGLIALAAVSVPSALIMRSEARSHTLREVEATAERMAHRLVAPLVDEAVLAGDPAALAALDEVIRVRTADGSIDRITIWHRDGRVVYSDAPGLTGEVFADHDWTEDVLIAGRPVAVHQDDGAPHLYEPDSGSFVEVDVAFESAAGESLIFEAYLPDTVVQAQQNGLLLRLLPIGLLTLVALQAAQLPPAVRLATTVQQLQIGRRRLLAQAAGASDVERRRLARDLHDDAIQGLVAASYGLESVQSRDSVVEPAVDASRALVREAIATLRGILSEVYPADLDAVGLKGALDALARRLREQGVDVSVEVRGATRLHRTEATLVYRVAREAMTNALRHASATRLDVELTVTNCEAVLRVVDDGCGFDVEAVPTAGHWGLHLINDAITEIGGVIEVRSRAGMGTTVTARVPVAEHPGDGRAARLPGQTGRTGGAAS